MKAFMALMIVISSYDANSSTNATKYNSVYNLMKDQLRIEKEKIEDNGVLRISKFNVIGVDSKRNESCNLVVTLKQDETLKIKESLTVSLLGSNNYSIIYQDKIVINELKKISKTVTEQRLVVDQKTNNLRLENSINYKKNDIFSKSTTKAHTEIFDLNMYGKKLEVEMKLSEDDSKKCLFDI